MSAADFHATDEELEDPVVRVRDRLLPDTPDAARRRNARMMRMFIEAIGRKQDDLIVDALLGSYFKT